MTGFADRFRLIRHLHFDPLNEFLNFAVFAVLRALLVCILVSHNTRQSATVKASWLPLDFHSQFRLSRAVPYRTVSVAVELRAT